MKRLEILIFSFLFSIISNAQSPNVIEASYFSKASSAPLLINGRGFHINDIYKETRACFTPESVNSKNLVARNESVATRIDIYCIKTNKEFTDYQSSKMSAGISFLNVFSLGNQVLNECITRNTVESERIIFSAKVDFGVFSFEKEPVLTAEAKALVDQNKLQDFVKVYGTHYISGIRKGNSITVVLKKINETRTNSIGSTSSSGVSAPIAPQVSVSIGSEDRNWANSQLGTSKFEISLEIIGPPIDQSTIHSDINNILSGGEQNKIEEISKTIGAALNKISDLSKASITQYYYSPFSLYGLEGINWDGRKQNQLMKINEAVVGIYSVKATLGDLTSSGGKDRLAIRYLVNKNFEGYKQMFENAYNQILPKLRALEQEAEKRLGELEAKYIKCSDVFCPNNPECCDNTQYIAELTDYDFNSRVEKEIDKIEAAVKEINRPECERLQKGVVKITNTSSNPYHIYNGDQFLETLAGNASKSYTVSMGTYNFKAVQQSGYVLYPTKNMRTALINKACQEVELRIGFQD